MITREEEKTINGNKFKFTCKDPYGFWSVELIKGHLKDPDKLKDLSFTTFDNAVLHANLSALNPDKNLKPVIMLESKVDARKRERNK